MCVPLLHRCVGVGAGCRFSPFGPHPATTSCPAKCTPPLGTETGSCRKMRRRFTPPCPSYVYYATFCLAPKGKRKASQEVQGNTAAKPSLACIRLLCLARENPLIASMFTATLPVHEASAHLPAESSMFQHAVRSGKCCFQIAGVRHIPRIPDIAHGSIWRHQGHSANRVAPPAWACP